MRMARSWKWFCGGFHCLFLLRRTALSIRCFTVGQGVREVGYDNERGKGDHRHLRGVESGYVFSTVEQLVADSWSDVRGLRGGVE